MPVRRAGRALRRLVAAAVLGSAPALAQEPVPPPIAPPLPPPAAQASPFEANPPAQADSAAHAGGAPAPAENAKPPSLFVVYFGAGSISMAPVNSTYKPDRSYIDPPPVYSSASGFEPVFGMRGGGPVGARVGLWGSMDIGYGFSSVDGVEQGQPKHYSFIESPFGIRGGVDIIIVPEVEAGPRIAIDSPGSADLRWGLYTTRLAP